MWSGGEGRDSEISWAAAFVLSSLLSPLRTAEGAVTGAGLGSVVADSGTWLGGDGSVEWRLVTGVILFGGVGGERLAWAGTMTTPPPGCESSAVNNQSQQTNTFNKMTLVITPCDIRFG